MNMSKRAKKVAKARLDIELAVLDIIDREQLTFVEATQALADTLHGLAKHAPRNERHPENPDSPADID
jgi:hypothetical protein